MKTDSINISKRLLLVASYTKGAKVLCDVGCDHAYLPVYAVLNGYVNNAIAMDIGEGPLQNAKVNIKKYGLEDKIKSRLSNGLESLEPGEADCIVIAGMGGILIRDILKNCPLVWMSADSLILSPHRDDRLLREYLSEKCFFEKDDFIEEKGTFYTVMKFLPKKNAHTLSNAEIMFGKNPTKEYLLHKKTNIEKILSSVIKNSKASDIIEKKNELENELSVIESLYDG